MDLLNDLLGSELFAFVRKHFTLIFFLIIFVVVPLVRNLLKSGGNKPTEESEASPDPEWERPAERVRQEKPVAVPEKPRPAYFEHKSREEFDPEEHIPRHRKGQTSQEKIELALSARNAPRHSPREGSEVQKSAHKSSQVLEAGDAHQAPPVSRIKKALSGKDMRELMIAGEIIQPRYF
ncbi:MAG: hypothetical protein JNM63_08300 [Spirochaetia bacterium]|nr:hypothetical protein [Spirochaetia bacterium]